MIKLVLWYVRKPGLTHAESVAANHRVHGSLVRTGPADFRSTLLRYTQSYPFDAAYGRTGAKTFDGVSELTYSSMKTMSENLNHPYYREVVQPDGMNFADEPANVVHLAEEEVVSAPILGDGIKIMRWLQSPSGTNADKFERFWAASYENAIGLLEGLRGYSRNRVPAQAAMSSGQPPTAYDSFWIDDQQDHLCFQEYHRKFISDGSARGVLDPEACFYLLCTERPVIKQTS